jgi:hypothetical protein
MTMVLGVTVWMKQHTVLGPVCAAMGTPHEMMAMPACQFRDALVADRTKAVLLLPQPQQMPLPLQVVSHTYAQTGFKVRLSLRIIRIGLACVFGVPTNRHTRRAEQAHILLRPIGTRDVTTEHPIVPVFGPKVLVPNPMAGLLRGSLPRPLPQEGKDVMVDLRKGPLARPMLVILRPAPNHGIQLPDQVSRDGMLVTRYDPADGV